MIDAISAIADALTAAGCDQIFYESDKLGNIKMDESLQAKIIGLIIEPNEIILNVKANAIQEHYPPIYVEILQQVRLETEGIKNIYIYESLLLICKKVIRKLIEYSQIGPDNMFSKILPMTITKVLESKYDANCIGWSMPLNVTYLKNENFCPITSP
jgi:hypothetical protein